MITMIASSAIIVVVWMILYVFQDIEEDDGSGKVTPGMGIRGLFHLMVWVIGIALVIFMWATLFFG